MVAGEHRAVIQREGQVVGGVAGRVQRGERADARAVGDCDVWLEILRPGLGPAMDGRAGGGL
jgi:hypothetical protein